LEDPLIGLGFAENREEVQDMIDHVDSDKSGQIEFEEFLSIIKGSNASDKTAKINKFFKDMTTGKLASEGISFNMFVQKMRRDYLKDAIMGDDPNRENLVKKY
jgi:Ca2+-binding EF-hand superfamily protein